MKLSDIYAQDTAIRVLRSSITRDNLAHAYLFAGPRNCGKTSAAIAFASSLNCMEPNENGESCGNCMSCIRIDSGNESDVSVIKPDGNQTKIEQMHNMIKSLNYAPLSGKYKVVIIEQADTLNPSSENSILKILEEPPEYAILILLSSNPGSLLPTIRSRCRKIRFRKASISETVDFLTNHTELSTDERMIIASCSQGLIGKASALASRADFMQERDQILQYFSEWIDSPDVFCIAFAEILRKIAEPGKNDEESRSRIRGLTDILDYIISWYADLLYLKTRGVNTPVSNYDRIDDLRAQSSLYSVKKIMNVIRSIMNAQRYIEGNITPQLVLETLFFDMRPDTT